MQYFCHKNDAQNDQFLVESHAIYTTYNHVHIAHGTREKSWSVWAKVETNLKVLLQISVCLHLYLKHNLSNKPMSYSPKQNTYTWSVFIKNKGWLITVHETHWYSESFDGWRVLLIYYNKSGR